MTKGLSWISPFMIPMMISNMASGLVSMEFGWRAELRDGFCLFTAACDWRSMADDS
jgi:hypothetical protein